MPTRASTVLSLALLLGGCAPALPQRAAGPAPLFRDACMTAAMASQALQVGRSTRQDVQALLGPGEALRFDSGYEVWVYRAREPQARPASGELVILFDPAGVVTKLRMRPGGDPQGWGE